MFNSAEHPHRVDFHSIRTVEFWAFWALMAGCFAIGFIPKRHKAPQAAAEARPPAEAA